MNILLGVSGSISAYRAADLSRELMRAGHTVRVCLTDAAQNFVSVVSACVHGRADVMGQISFENGKTSEIGAVRDLLQQLDVEGVWFTMDALHCQKNG